MSDLIEPIELKTTWTHDEIGALADRWRDLLAKTINEMNALILERTERVYDSREAKQIAHEIMVSYRPQREAIAREVVALESMILRHYVGNSPRRDGWGLLTKIPKNFPAGGRPA